MTTHLIIPDAHAMPNVSNERFTWLGKLVAEIQPDVIVDIGDWCDMESLCIYDKGKLQFEGRRYKKDVQCALDAKERFENDMNRLHSCRVDKREHGKVYLSSISRRYAFEMFEGGDDNWEIIN